MDVIDLIREGESLFQEGDVVSSRYRFKEALSLAPEDPQLHNRMGMLEMSQGNPDKAKLSFEEACRLAPEVSRYHMRLGDSFQRLNQFDDAIQSYASSLRLEPKNASAWNNRGFANFNLNRWNEALRCYDESMRSDPSYAVAWYNYGYTLQLSGRLADSKAYYQKAVELDPDDKIAWNNLANVYYNQGHYERSIVIYKKSLEIDKDYVIAINNIGNALDHLHRYEESIPYHERSIELDSTFHYAFMAKGRALTSLGRPEEGLDFIQTSIELEDSDPDYHEALARCFMALNMDHKARLTINLGLSLDGQHVPCWITLGDINLRLNDKIKALQCFDEAVRAQDVFSRSRMRDLDWIEKGRILIEAGIVYEGFRQYSNAISAASETSRPYFKKAEIELEFGLLREAAKTVGKGLDIDPDSLIGNKILVQAMEAEKLVDKVDDIISKHPNSSSLKRHIGVKIMEKYPDKALLLFGDSSYEDLLLKTQSYSLLSENELALSCALRCVEIDSASIEGWLAAGWSSYKLGLFSQANEYFDGAMGCKRQSIDALVGKALVLQAEGKEYSSYYKAIKNLDANFYLDKISS